jgi:DNA-binding response OmpR family regulator
MTHRIAVVEDDPDVRRMLVDALTEDGYEVAGFADGAAATGAIQTKPPSLVVLDLLLPGRNGIQVCKALRAHPATNRVPILMLTGLSAAADEVLGFEVGADDYVTKPFQIAPLLARVAALLRRLGPLGNDATLTHGPLVLHPARREAVVAGRPLLLTPTEFRMLHLLVANPTRVMTRLDLLEAEPGRDVTERNVDVHINSIRRKLDGHEWLIDTVYGKGYRIANPTGPTKGAGRPAGGAPAG